MIEFRLPDLGEGISEAEIVAWLVREGDVVEEHQELLQVETDKALVSVPAPAAGRVGPLMHAAGDTVPVGEVLLTLLPVGEAATAAAGGPARPPEPAHASAGTAHSGARSAPVATTGVEPAPGPSPADPAVTIAATPAVNGHNGHGPHAGGTSPLAATGGRTAVAPAPPPPPAADDAGSVVGKLSTDGAGTAGGQAGVLASPAVRRLARVLEVDLDRIAGTGPSGRITEADVRRAAETAPTPRERRVAAATGAAVLPPPPRESGTHSGAAAPHGAPQVPGTPPPEALFAGGIIELTDLGPVEKRPLRGVRKAIAVHLSKAARVVVPVTQFDDADVTELVRIRNKQRAAAEQESGVKLTYLPFIIKAVVQALKEHPHLNSVLDDERGEIIIRRYYNIGIAVDTAEGLMVPVIRAADAKSMLQIAAEVQHLSRAAKDRTLRIEQLRGGTFTITNIGTIGGTYATPIVNHPEAAILAVGRIRDQIVPRRGKAVVRKIAGLSLTFDHRLIDGGDAARFLNSVKRHVEDPDLILIKSYN